MFKTTISNREKHETTTKEVIDPKYVPEPYVEIDVLGKTPDAVADEIIGHAEKHKAAGNDAGSVIVLCGLSGTGKVRQIMFIF